MQPAARRIGILFALFLGFLTIAVVRAGYLATVRANSLKHAARTQQSAVLTIPAHRGTIVDRHGIPLAVSQSAADISATPYLVKDAVKAAQKLAPFLDTPEDQIVKDLARRDTGFVYLQRQVRADKAQQIADLKIAGIDETQTTARTYPRDWLASQVLGTVGTDGKGLSGLEYGFDRTLHGSDGERRTVRDAIGQPIHVQDLRPTRPGQELQMSLDAAIQDKAEAVLSQVGATYRPKRATAIVMNPASGELLAVANWPRVDANDVGGAPASARQDMAVGYTYEPGSTFKAFTVAGALQDHVVTPDTTFGLAPTIQVADRTIGEAEGRGGGGLCLAPALPPARHGG